MASLSIRTRFISIAATLAFGLSSVGAANAQGIPAGAGANLSPITLRGNTVLARTFGGGDVIPSPGIIPTDITPTRIGEERELIRPGFKFYLMQKLPPRMWFNSVTEVTNRFESNVLFTPRNPRRDYVYRVLPNMTLGYNLAANTSVYVNYFLIKDVFARTGFLSNPTFMSLAGGIRQEVPIGTRSNLQADVQVRQLWQARNLRQADILPGLTFTHVFNPKLIGFANSQLQLRSRNLFATGTFREIDPFFTVGLLGRWRDWNAIATNTFVANFRYPQAIPPQRNYAVISDFELNRPISKKVPGLLAFFRAEPIWNFGGRSLPGLSGFDFRIFGGIRMSITKPSYYAQMEKLRRQLEQVTENPNQLKKITERKNTNRIAQSLNEPSQIPVEMAIDIAHDEGSLPDSIRPTIGILNASTSRQMSPGEYQIRKNLMLLKEASRIGDDDDALEVSDAEEEKKVEPKELSQVDANRHLAKAEKVLEQEIPMTIIHHGDESTSQTKAVSYIAPVVADQDAESKSDSDKGDDDNQQQPRMFIHL